MNAFLIFDENSLIFACDPNRELEHFLLQLHGHKWSAADDDEVVHNLITLYLQPFVSVHRQLAHSPLRLDSLPGTCIVHQTWQQFVFLHLCQSDPSNDEEGEDHKDDDDASMYLFLQRKVIFFARVVLFLFGNALYSIEKHEHNLKILLKMLTKWDSLNMQVPFLLESIETICLGFHMEGLQRQMVSRVEKLMKLQMNEQGQNAARETPTCSLVLFKDKLLYKHESAHSRLCQEDMLSVLLLTLSVHLYPGPGSDISSEGSNLDESVTGDRTCSHFQQLVFLSSSYQIPVPHIYRKVMIAEDLCFISLAEVSSLLMISLPTLMNSVSELKLDLTVHKLDSRKSIENLTSCVRNLHRYINKNVRSVLPPQQAFNFGPFEELAHLVRKAGNSPGDLVREQADRMLSLILNRLHVCYNEVAFSNMQESFSQHMQHFENISHEVDDLLQETFSTCLDYIHVKHDTSHLAIGTACEQFPSLEAVLFVDRSNGHFVLGHLEGNSSDGSRDLLCGTILRAYQQVDADNSTLVTWSDGERRYVAYLFCPHVQFRSIRVATCAIARIFQGECASPAFAELAVHPSAEIYELFCVFKESTLNAEQISPSNIEKLIKLYINR